MSQWADGIFVQYRSSVPFYVHCHAFGEKERLSLDPSLLKMSLNQVVQNQSVPTQLRSMLVSWGSGRLTSFTGVVAVAPLASVGQGWRVSGPSLGCSPQPLWLLLLLENKRDIFSTVTVQLGFNVLADYH